MSRSTIIIAAVVLAAVLAGLLWYQLTTPAPQTTQPSPTAPVALITAAPAPTATVLPTPIAIVAPENPPITPSAASGPEHIGLLAALTLAAGVVGILRRLR